MFLPNLINNERLTESQQSYLNDLMSYFIIDNHLPFNLLESPSFKSFLKAINPQFTPICSATLSTNLLDKLYTKTKNAVTEELKKQKYVAIAIDGSSDNCSEPVSNVIALTNKEDILVEVTLC